MSFPFVDYFLVRRMVQLCEAGSLVDRRAASTQTELWLMKVLDNKYFKNGRRLTDIDERFATSSFLFLVVRPGAPSSVLAPSSDARSP